MHSLLEELFKTRSFISNEGKNIQIHSETSRDQCIFLQKIISENNFKKSIEIGFAYGISTLAIIEAITKNGGIHVAVDKFEKTDWEGIGLDIISQAGYKYHLEFIEEFCYFALPGLLEANRQFDFAYVDSTKQFDWLLIDFFYIDKLLSIHGVIVFDDVDFPGINKLVRFILSLPNYKIYAACSPVKAKISKKKKQLLSVLKYIPKVMNCLSIEIQNTDDDLGINYRCLAVIKTADDERNWDWHKNF